MDRLFIRDFRTHYLLPFRIMRVAVAVLSVMGFFALSGNASAAKSVSFSAASPSLNFGSFAVLNSCSSCTITISPSGVRTASSGIVLLGGAAGSAAAFSATGTGCNGGCQYSVTTPPPASVAISAGAVTMTVGSYTYSPGPLVTPNILYVGATLTIPSSGATPGSYTSGSYTITTNP